MTSTNPTTPNLPDFAALLAEPAAAANDVPTQPMSDSAPRERTTARVRVFHNNEVPESFLRGYETGQTVTEVFAFDETNFDPKIHDHLSLAEHAFELLNIGDDPEFGTPDQRAVDYRRRGNRSLSVGDVLAIDERFLSCDRIGFRELDQPPAIQQLRQHGTTPLHD